ncbi:hypothetical protein ACMHYB_55350 [Sorangium sp. So ce1128]
MDWGRHEHRDHRIGIDLVEGERDIAGPTPKTLLSTNQLSAS